MLRRLSLCAGGQGPGMSMSSEDEIGLIRERGGRRYPRMTRCQVLRVSRLGIAATRATEAHALVW